MIDLADKCGLPMMLDENTGSLIYDKSCVGCGSEKEVLISEIGPALLNQFIKYPEKVYKEYEKLSTETDRNEQVDDALTYDVINLPFGLLGIEFIKTHIYFTPLNEDKFACIVQVILGELTVFVQRNREEDPNSFYAYVESVEIIKMSEGDTLAIPTGAYYTFVNSSNTKTLFALICSRGRTIVNYSSLNHGKGLAYYIISKNGKAEIVANPKYKSESPPVFVSWSEADEDLRGKFGLEKYITLEGALYEIFRSKLQELREILV